MHYHTREQQLPYLDTGRAKIMRKQCCLVPKGTIHNLGHFKSVSQWVSVCITVTQYKGGLSQSLQGGLHGVKQVRDMILVLSIFKIWFIDTEGWTVWQGSGILDKSELHCQFRYRLVWLKASQLISLYFHSPACKTRLTCPVVSWEMAYLLLCLFRAWCSYSQLLWGLLFYCYCCHFLKPPWPKQHLQSPEHVRLQLPPFTYPHVVANQQTPEGCYQGSYGDSSACL